MLSPGYGFIGVYYCILFTLIIGIIGLVSAGLGYAVFNWQNPDKELQPKDGCAAVVVAGFTFVILLITALWMLNQIG